MDNLKSLRKAVEEIDIASIVPTEVEIKNEEAEKKVEKSEVEEKKRELSQNKENSNSNSSYSQLSGKKMRKIVKPPPEAPRQRKRRLPRKRLPRKRLSRNMHFWLYDLCKIGQKLEIRFFPFTYATD
nr:PREDICTED: uncharacterized protein LOC105663762 [Megachile rotundata]